MKSENDTPLIFSAQQIQFMVLGWRPPGEKSVCSFCGNNGTKDCPFKGAPMPADGFCSDFRQVPPDKFQELMVADIESSPPLECLVRGHGITLE